MAKLILLLSVLFAQQRIGYVDSERIINEYEEAKQARLQLEKEVHKWKLQLDSLKNEYLKKKEEYESQEPMLSDQAKLQRQRELNALKQKYENFAKEIWGEHGKIEQKKKELFDPIIEKIVSTIEEIAKEEGYTMILDVSSGVVLYAVKEDDITDKVIDELNKIYAPIVGPVIKKKIAILNIVARDAESQEEKIPEMVKNTLNAVLEQIKNAKNLDIIDESTISNALQQRGISSQRELSENEVYSLGRDLDADFIITGHVQKRGEAVDLTLILYAPKEMKKLAEETERAERKEKIQETTQRIFEKLKNYL